ncbi:capsule polysaccharide biosynthesis protein [Clostridiales bacterium oral taxon 876 str. F0540]|nr:capsule polysaccharide biosynthesis protein [Clostridiales bacterium oral taxon 876 str. F0540]
MVKLYYINSLFTLFIDSQKEDITKFLQKININQEAFKFLTFIENQQIEGFGIDDLYEVENIKMYYFVRPSIYEQIKNYIFIINVIDSIMNKFDSIEIYTDDANLNIVTESIFNIKSSLLEGNNKVSKSYKYIFKYFFRSAKSLRALVKLLINRDKDRFLVVSHSADINKIESEDGDLYYDTQLGLVVDRLKSHYNLLNLQLLNSNEHLTKSIVYKEEYVPFELFSLYKRVRGVKLLKQRKITNKLGLLNRIDYRYRGFNLNQVMINHIFKDIKGEYESYAQEILCAENFMKYFKIKKCLIAGEGDRGRCFITAAKILGIKAFAVQHGIINEYSPSYIVNCKNQNKLIPDMTFLWGEKYKKVLKNCTNIYNYNNTKVVGQVRTDLLRERVNNNIQEDKSTIRILYATQYIKDLLEPATKILFEALNNLYLNYELVIKLHPSDKHEGLYKQLVSEYNIKNVSILKDGDIYSMIKWSDIIVSVHSTVIVEGAIFNKPSICIVMPKYNDEGNFIKDGVSYSARTWEDIVETVKRVYVNGEDILYAYRLDYIVNNFYKIDGKVTDRIIELINVSER